MGTVTKLASSPLSLLRLIRDVMAQATSAQGRLDQVVALIAEGFSSEVCSVYLLRAGDVLELYATQGLNAASVHRTRLSVGQGLVGYIAASAAPLNLAHAEAHPKFEYRPETGEEIYSSFSGAPMLQGGKVIGVLVVQSREAREYTADQVEVLQTVAMVLSELALSGQLITAQELATTTGGLVQQQLSGIRLSSGIARACAWLHEPNLVIEQFVATDIASEHRRLDDALSRLSQSFDQAIQHLGMSDDSEERQILETHLLLTQDRGWRTRTEEAITSGLTAEAAVKKVQEGLKARMSQVGSPYIRERMQDLEDVSRYLIKTLQGAAWHEEGGLMPEACILVARSLGPAELLAYDTKRIKGIVLEEGSTSSHTAVIARAMDIPTLSKVAAATIIIQSGDPLILDAEAGVVYVRPSDVVEAELLRQMAENAARAAEYQALEGEEAITRDGVRISLNVNAGLFVDAPTVAQAGVDGVGLYRTELPYMTALDFPTVAEQRAHYAQIVQAVSGKRVIFRSFDIGGDKKVPYLHAEHEENPAMGWRASRIGLDQPGILRAQFRALIQASGGKPLQVMFPFIAEVAEFETLKKWMLEEVSRATIKPSALKLGVMIEIPSLLWQLDALLPRVDFVSVGSNDLMQFLFACDRGGHMTERYDTLSPVMLSVVSQIAEKAAQQGVEAGFCGEMARRPLDALALIGCGMRSLSVSASAVGPLKMMIRSLDLASLVAYIAWLKARPEASIRHWLKAYAHDHGIRI